jgi:hypothetical protein
MATNDVATREWMLENTKQSQMTLARLGAALLTRQSSVVSLLGATIL